jgi:pimeloyl-ACP methyl ester carboxylesterase
MMPAENVMSRQRPGDLTGRLRPLLLVGAVWLAHTAAALAGGDSLVIRSGGAELRSASPREAGKAPVVFVHGMLGSPGNWSVLIDRLSADPSLRERFHFLTFGYDSLQPVADSGRELLEALAEARRRSDPEGHDDAFDQVVLVGHSLGGLVVKDAAARSQKQQPAGGTVSGRVGRMIFVATPHRGSPVDRGAVRSVGSWLARAISPSVAARREGGDGSALRTPTSVDQLTWDHPLLGDLDRANAAAAVPYHSIVAALGDPTADGATDGLVPVASARLEGARSEVLVRAHHVCFQHPELIREVGRVLGEHAAELARRPAPAAGAPLAGSLGAITVPPAPQGDHLAAIRLKSTRLPEGSTGNDNRRQGVPDGVTP